MTTDLSTIGQNQSVWNPTVTASDIANTGANLFVQITVIDGANQGQVALDNIVLDHTVVPEPSSTALLSLGGLALIMRRRK